MDPQILVTSLFLERSLVAMPRLPSCRLPRCLHNSTRSNQEQAKYNGLGITASCPLQSGHERAAQIPWSDCGIARESPIAMADRHSGCRFGNLCRIHRAGGLALRSRIHRRPHVRHCLLAFGNCSAVMAKASQQSAGIVPTLVAQPPIDASGPCQPSRPSAATARRFKLTHYQSFTHSAEPLNERN